MMIHLDLKVQYNTTDKPKPLQLDCEAIMYSLHTGLVRL